MASRRSANYQSSSWDYRTLQALLTDPSIDENLPVPIELVEKVRQQAYDQMNPLRQVEYIEAVDRLGLDYLFQEDIHQVLSVFSRDGFEEVIHCGLRATSICFRLLRRFGFQVSEHIFNDFLDEKKTFKASHAEDVIGLLSLYQASYMAFDDEHVMEAARSFACTQLNEKKASCSLYNRALISHAMNLPLHWRMPWMEARTFLDLYELQDGMSPELLLLAKRHFNAIQNVHQKELSKVVIWWLSLDIQRTISFSRDRIIECFFYAVGIVHHPEYGICRDLLTKVGMLVATIDDVYDLYGSVEELELFTRVVDRWPDVNGMKELPDYMKALFSALIDTINEVVKHLSTVDRLVAMPYIHKVWTDLFKAFLQEAKWHNNGYMPTLKEYLSVASISTAGQVILLHAYIFLKCKITTKVLQHLQDFPNIIRLPSLIFRLCNDLATNMAEQERGDAPTSIQCYINEMGTSQKEAYRHISTLVHEAWKQLNGECFSDLTFPQSFIDASINLARMASFMYHKGDSFSSPNHEIKETVKSLFLNKI